MTDAKVSASIKAALDAFTRYGNFNASALNNEFEQVFGSDDDFMTKVDALDTVFDDNPEVEELRQVFFDLLMINFFSEDVKKLEEDYLDSAEWEEIEEDTLDRGTELLNLLLYLNECEDEEIEPELDDYLKEFLLVDDDEFQDEYRIYEPIIANQILMDSPVEEITKIAKTLPEDSELVELFYPIMCFFQNTEPTTSDEEQVAINSVNKSFDMAVFCILVKFK